MQSSHRLFASATIALLSSILLLIVLGTGRLKAQGTAGEEGFKPIFDGRSLSGWDGDPKFWRVEEGAIVGETTPENPTRGNTFIVWRHGELDDFELRLEYRIRGGNSGVQYRSFQKPDWGKWVVGGYQADLEAGDTWSGACYAERERGILARRGESTVIRANHKPEVVGTVGDSKEIQAAIRKEDWNSYRIVARGFELLHEINGTATAKVVDEDAAMRRRGGILALQLHAGPPMKVEFRNIRLKRLKMLDQKKLVFVAGKPSHGRGDHEFNAGALFVKKALDAAPGAGVHTTVYLNRPRRDREHPVMDRGWPLDPTAFDNADGIVLFMDGGDDHPVNHRLDEVDALMKRGVGLACLHYGVEVPKGKSGERFLDWIGGYFEKNLSVNPHWVMKDPKLAEGHPITRGVKPFSANDEWYFNMRFPDDMKGVTPILSAVPPKDTMNRPDGPHSGNPIVRERVAKGMLEHLAWARERPGGGRGFGFTGLHYHRNFQNDDFRKLVLNALVWITGAEVPGGGVPSKTPTDDELVADQDPK
jgi:hypothetical protein